MSHLSCKKHLSCFWAIIIDVTQKEFIVLLPALREVPIFVAYVPQFEFVNVACLKYQGPRTCSPSRCAHFNLSFFSQECAIVQLIVG
jgi:hypothetical protein